MIVYYYDMNKRALWLSVHGHGLRFCIIFLTQIFYAHSNGNGKVVPVLLQSCCQVIHEDTNTSTKYVGLGIDPKQ